MLYDVLSQVATDTGLSLSDNINRLLQLANRGAREIYKRLECNKIYWEITLSVPPNKIVTLPSYIGELRGMRTSITEVPFMVNSMSSPRYVKDNWQYKWKNWRDLGESAVQQNPAVVAPLVINATPEATPVTLYISAQTNSATRLEEQVLINQPVVQTVNSFGPLIWNIACPSPNRTNDITVSDQQGNLLATLANCDKKTRYKLIDVSQFAWPVDESNQNSLIDVLYKSPLRLMNNPSDQFPAGDDYDEAWYYATMWQYYLSVQNKQKESVQSMQDMMVCLDATKDGSERSIEKKFTFGRNKYHDAVRNTFNLDDVKYGNGRPNGWPYLNWDS